MNSLHWQKLPNKNSASQEAVLVAAQSNHWIAIAIGLVALIAGFTLRGLIHPTFAAQLAPSAVQPIGQAQVIRPPAPGAPSGAGSCGAGGGCGCGARAALPQT